LSNRAGQREGNSTRGIGDNVQTRTGIGVDAVSYENENKKEEENNEENETPDNDRTRK